VSVLRRAFGVPHEERAVGVNVVRLPTKYVPDIPEGYGQPGFGSWGPGMEWHSWAGAGSAVGPEQAMRLSAVFGCLRLLSQAVSTLPLDTYIRQNGARRPWRPRPDYLSFGLPGMSRITYLSQVVMSQLADGNAFVATPRNDLGEPLALIPLDPCKITVERRRGQVVYRMANDNTDYTYWDILHIPIAGLMLPGQLRGMSPLGAAREVIDGGRKAQEFGNSFMSNHAVPPAVIKVPGAESSDPKANKEKAARVASMWQETNGGGNVGKVGVLIGGAELQTIAISPQDAQWLDSKRFGVSEIARFFGVPPHLIADASNSTSWGSGLAEQNLAFGQFSLRPLIESIEEEHGRLLTTHGLPDVFVKLNLDALLRASLSDRYASYSVGIGSRFLTPNEARRLEDLAPLDGGDTFAPSPPDAPGGAA
jgi:HK97 family phage portal protein